MYILFTSTVYITKSKYSVFISVILLGAMLIFVFISVILLGAMLIFVFISNDSPRLAMPAAGCQCLKSCSFKNKIKCCILFDTGCGCTRGLNRVISN